MGLQAAQRRMAGHKKTASSGEGGFGGVIQQWEY
jgi:hypothetical protein